MASLAERIKLVLDECRMVILGAQVLLGVEYRAIFEEGFAHLPIAAQVTLWISVGLVSGTLSLLFVPATYHLIVENGQDTQRLHDLSTRMIEVGMVPFAIAMGCLCYLATQPIASPALAVGVGISGTLAAFFFWYALEWIRRQRRTPALLGGEEEDSVPVTDLKAKIEHVLQEARMVLPGAQALLGFQFACILTTSFGRLTPAFQVVHVMALLVIALATILLIAPAAYHRLVEHGEATESFHQVAGRFLLSAIACLGLGMAAEFSVVTWVITHDAFVAFVLGTAVLAANYAIWFGYAFYRRRHPLPARIRAS